MNPILSDALQAWHRVDCSAQLFGRINRLTIRMTLLLATLLLFSITAADYFTGIELMMAPIYAFPCLLVDWRIGRTPALLYALAASYLQWFIGTFGGRNYSHASYVYLDVILNIVFYGALIWVVSKLRLALEMERVLSRVDFLTHVITRSALAERLTQEVRRCRRERHGLAVLTVDCDNFNQFNLARGHGTGDLLLQLVADTLQRKFVDDAVVARSGDDEFMVVVSKASADDMRASSQSLRSQLDTAMALRGWPISFSLACSVFEMPSGDANWVFEKQALVMKRAKLEGKSEFAMEVWAAEQDTFKSGGRNSATKEPS